MNNFEKAARLIIAWAVTLLVPFALSLSAARLIGTSPFLQYEYNRSGFPADPYGFTTADRLTYSQVSLNYLLSESDPAYISGQRLADGTPLYNERELSHMEDVKRLVGAAMSVWQASLGLVVGLGLAAWGAKWQDSYLRGLGRGGWFTVALIVFILVNVLINFDAFFVGFHRIFFQENTWMFEFSDSFIRLFPLAFWQDAFIFVGVFTLVGAGLLIWFFGRPQSKKYSSIK